MKFGRVCVGVFCILAAALGVLDALGVMSPLKSRVGDLSLLEILVGLVLLPVVVTCLFKRHWIQAVWALGIGFIVWEDNLAMLCGRTDGELINNWALLGVMILLGVGLKLLFPRKSGHWYEHWGDNGNKSRNDKCVIDKHGMGSNVVYIDSAAFENRYQENNMGSTVIRFENAELYQGGGVLHIENNMGSTVVHLPAAWSLDMQMENNMGSIRNLVGIGGNGPSVRIIGENNMGSVVIQSAGDCGGQ